MGGPRLTRYGDRAWLVEFEPRVDVDVSEAVLALASSLRAALGADASDVVPAIASLAVHASRDADLNTLDRRLQALVPYVGPGFSPARQSDSYVGPGSSPARQSDSYVGPGFSPARFIEIPVVYGGDAGPDLPAVAAATGLSESEVVRIHTAGSYHVFMLGFMPGFPYLGPVEPSIQVPRLSTPRSRVPAGSVGLAGAQTGIYPKESPGGWQIIGRTEEWLFDASRNPPARLEPGDRVRFVDATPGTGAL